MSDQTRQRSAREDCTRRRFLAQSALLAATGAATPLATRELIAQVPVRHQENPENAAPPPPATRMLADWVVHCEPSAVPQTARKEALRSLVNWLGVAVGGSSQDAVKFALAALTPLSYSTGTAIFGRPERVNILWAALVNGISSHVLDFDDTDLRTIIHPAGPIAGALFAICQAQRVSGAAFLHAFILGVEVECRLGRAIYPSHYEMGWHITGTCGAFGAAAACGKILGLDTRQTQMALGIAATEAAGLKIMFGSMCKSLNIGRAAENGLTAALLASKGFTSAEDAIEGKEGYIYAASTHHNYAALTEELGEHYEISNDTYKPFACGIVIHPAIDAILQLRAAYHLKPADVRSITVRANPLALQLTGKQEPRDGLESKFSIYHSVAVALVRGHAGPPEYSDEAVNNPIVVALRRRVTVRPDPMVRTDEVFMTLTTTDGRMLEKHIEHAVGSTERPLTDAELDDKYRQLTKDILPPPQAEALLSLAWHLESCPDAAELPRNGAQRVEARHG